MPVVMCQSQNCTTRRTASTTPPTVSRPCNIAPIPHFLNPGPSLPSTVARFTNTADSGLVVSICSPQSPGSVVLTRAVPFTFVCGLGNVVDLLRKPRMEIGSQSSQGDSKSIQTSDISVTHLGVGLDSSRPLIFI